MLQVPFLQTMAVAALAAILLVVVAMPAGLSLGPRAGRWVLRVSLVGFLAVAVVSLAQGSAMGDLARFNAAHGMSDWLQMGGFFLIVYGTGYRFVSAYLTDKQKEADDA